MDDSLAFQFGKTKHEGSHYVAYLIDRQNSPSSEIFQQIPSLEVFHEDVEVGVRFEYPFDLQ